MYLFLLLLAAQQHRRHVAGNMLLIKVVATLLFYSVTTTITAAAAPPSPATATQYGQQQSTVSLTWPSAITTPTATAITSLSNDANSTEFSADASAEREVIGATSLAAAAGAAAAMAGTLPMARSNSDSNSSANTTSNNINNNNNANIYSNSDKESSGELLAKSANLLLEHLQQPTGQIVNLTRQHDGDIFRTSGVSACNADTCVGLSSGTAGLVHLGVSDKNDNFQRGLAVGTLAGGTTMHGQPPLPGRRVKPTTQQALSGETCECRCLPYLSTYREDLGICVDDLHECTLSPFVSGSSSEKIPFVFLPLRGQIIYPSREISFPDIRTPVCAVTGAQYLNTNGWSDLRNPIDTDYPFRMFRDEGRTFLQWLGEADLRQKMQGRLIVVHLVCRDMTITLNATTKEHIAPPKNVFSPCVAFRVNGTPVKYTHNVSEVLFQAETTSTLASTSDGMSTKEYVVIGICSLLLGLIYVASVFLYLHMKKRKSREQSHTRSSLDDLANEINYPKNDQVTFGVPFHRSGSIYSAASNEPRSRASIGSLKEEMGIIKNNPLLQHFPQLSDHHSGFASDVSNSNSECEMDGSYHDKLKQMQTAALVHPQLGKAGANNSSSDSPKSGTDGASGEERLETSASPTSENECLPVENVSVVEDMMTEEKLEHLRAMVNGNVRKKLYFNPAYFEPHLLAQPPPAAIEFLQKIREVIAIAKYKMATKRYQPSLIMIPEESPLRSNTPSLYGSQMQTTPPECPGCVNNRCSGHVKNCGDKRNSIEKWLQSVSGTDQLKSTSVTATDKGDAADKAIGVNTNDQQHLQQKSGNSPQRQQLPLPKTATGGMRPSGSRKELTPPKQSPPPPPTPKNNRPTNRNSGPLGINKPEPVYEESHEELRTSMNSASYQQYCTSITTGSSVTIPVNRTYESFSALSAAANIYGFAETGSEIYNNPKFTLHDSPAASQRSHNSSHRSKTSRQRLEALDQFATASTPTSLNTAERQRYEMLRNMKHPCDPYGYYSVPMSGSGGGFHLDIPTPDYDSTIEKKIKDIYNNTQSSAPSVPTPDYSTLSRKSIKQFQPDSPIYRRKSPQYLIVDYETDSLERLEATKRKSSQSSSSPSSDVSSQLSPSLSTALPLEEELEISHTVYNSKTDGFRKESDTKKKFPMKMDSNVSKQREIAARIKYDTPFRGSMTIEVEHEPQSDLERSTDSDQFEPDTLDRKPKKQSFCDIKPWPPKINQAPQHLQAETLNNYQPSNSHTSLPDMSSYQYSPPSARTHIAQSSFVLRASNSFRDENPRNSNYEGRVELRVHQRQEVVEVPRPAFTSLQEIYQTPIENQSSQQGCKCGGQMNSQYTPSGVDPLGEPGRLLTLEAKQKRRQQIVQPPPPPPSVEISKVAPNKTTIKITTPKSRRAIVSRDGSEWQAEATIVTAHQKNNSPISSPSDPDASDAKIIYDQPKIVKATEALSQTPASTLNSEASSKPSAQRKRRSPALPPPPPPPTASASTTLNSQKSCASSQRTHKTQHYQNHHHSYTHHSTTTQSTNTTEEETNSNHSESTEITGVSDNFAHSEMGGSCDNTLSSIAHHTAEKQKFDAQPPVDDADTDCDTIYKQKKVNSPPLPEKAHCHDSDYGAMFNTQINGLRSDYSLTKYLNRRKSHDNDENEDNTTLEAQLEANNNMNVRHSEADVSKLDVLSISSRSNRSSSRLSDRTKEMYRNAGVPVGIAYPQQQRSTSTTSVQSTITPPTISANTTANVQTVYRCEIEPVQLTHGMQIAMGLKDRAKKAKDLKNAWKKFVSMAAAKFSPTHSPAPPYDKKTPSFLEVLDRDEGISSLIDEHPRVSTPKSSYSAPASQNYYEQRFGPRPQEMDSGYMSADSGEVYKRSFYDRYNFKLMSGRDHIIRVDTIEDNSDGGSTITGRHNGGATGSRRSSILDSNRFEDLEHMGEPPENENNLSREDEQLSDAGSDKTLTQRNCKRPQRIASARELYSSEDERGGRQSPSCGSSETDGETNPEDMWESGAESIETHSVLYKNVRKN